MKRMVSFVTAALLALTGVGCSNNLDDSGKSSSSAASGASSGASAPVDGDELLTGLAVITGAGSSKEAGAEPGFAQINSDVVAVLVDGNGRIVNCKIDAVQSKIEFTGTGELVGAADQAFPTKQELGTAYGLKEVSGIGREWNEQVNALAAYVVGKTADEVKGIAVNEKTAPTDAELSSSVTIAIGGYLDAIYKAAGNARKLGARRGDKLGIGIVTTGKDSAPAGAEDGVAQAASTYAAASFGADGKITSCILDGSNSDVGFTAAGKLTLEKDAKFETKNELGDNYGMKKASSIGKEWYQQAEAYASYALGRTAEELKGIAVNEKGAPTGAELTASVTISVGAFNEALLKAADYAG